jgi:hypothetical protein
MPPSFDVDIDLFAELSARLDDPFAEHVAVLLGAGLDRAALVHLQDRWKTRLQQATDEAMHLTQRFAATYARTQQVLEEARRDARLGAGKRAPDPRFLSAQVQTWREEAAAVALSVSADASSPALDTTSPAPVRRDPPPSANAAPEPPSTPDWVPRGMRRFEQLAVTQAADDPPASAGLPFDPSAEPQLPDRTEAPAWMPKGMRGFSTAGGTQAAPEIPDGPVLPFAPPAAPQAPAPTPPEHAVPPGMRGFADVRGTLHTPEDLPTGPALPFDSSAIPRSSASTEAPAWMPKGMLRFVDVGGTQHTSEEPAGAAMPFEASRTTLERFPIVAPPRPPDPAAGAAALTLEQYASLCVELDAEQSNRPEILGRYRISEEQARKLEAHWRAKFAVEPSLKAQWQQAYAAYEAWLLSARPPLR